MEERLEDGELGLQRGNMCRAKSGAMGGIGGREGGAVLESRETDRAPGGHYPNSIKYQNDAQ